jgi:hypothetical protein
LDTISPLSFTTPKPQKFSSPGFLAQVRVTVFNRMHGQLTAEDANSAWAETAVASPDCRAEKVESCLGRRFGEKRGSFDLSLTSRGPLIRCFTRVETGESAADPGENPCAQPATPLS